MLVLGIESSCDDMAAAVVENGTHILSSVVSSQDEIHKRYGGIVPELASRKHIESIVPVVETAMKDAALTLEDLDGIAVTQGPGLVGSLLIGLSFAKGVSYARKIPFTGVNHIVAHPYAAFIGDGCHPEFPFIALVVSGGHTVLFRFDAFLKYRMLGQTRDDAAGEAFDKVAKLLGFGYPGGVVIDRLSRTGNPSAIEFKRPYISKDTLDFSFSGIKTAVLNHLRNLDGELSDRAKSNLAASFQEAVVDVLVEKSVYACKTHGIRDLVIAGGVACNSRLRKKLGERRERECLRFFTPPPSLCSDNGASIASAGFYSLREGRTAALTIDADPRLHY